MNDDLDRYHCPFRRVEAPKQVVCFVQSGKRADRTVFAPLLECMQILQKGYGKKSTYHLAAALTGQGYAVSQRTVYRLLEALGYSLPANRKTQEGAAHPDRDAQFLFIYRQGQRFQKKKLLVISVDTKKKENLGTVAQEGHEWEPRGRPTKVQTYDFPDPQQGPARPYGIYDLTRTEGGERGD